MTAISRGFGAQGVKMVWHCCLWSCLSSWRKYCLACLRSYCSGFNSHESRCRIYTILQRKLLEFIQVHTRCCVGIGPTRRDSWKSTADPRIPQSFPQLTLTRLQRPTPRPSIVKRADGNNIYSVLQHAELYPRQDSNQWAVVQGVFILWRIYAVSAVIPTCKIDSWWQPICWNSFD
jgi:hypothetical protein